MSDCKVEQYRHGSNTVELEIPAHHGPARHFTVQAGLRDCGRKPVTKATGGTDRPGICQPGDPHNTMYTVLVPQFTICGMTGAGYGEDIETHLVHWGNPALIAAGRIGIVWWWPPFTITRRWRKRARQE